RHQKQAAAHVARSAPRGPSPGNGGAVCGTAVGLALAERLCRSLRGISFLLDSWFPPVWTQRVAATTVSAAVLLLQGALQGASGVAPPTHGVQPTQPTGWTVALPSSRSSAVMTGIAAVGGFAAPAPASGAAAGRRSREGPAAGEMITGSNPAASRGAALACVTTPICTPI